MVMPNDKWFNEFNEMDGEQAFSVLGCDDRALRAKR
jgi:hypothetical protein